MFKIKFVTFALAIIFLLTALASAQTQFKKRRISRADLKKVEIYFDGGYYITDFASANDALTQGLDYLTYRLETLNDTLYFTSGNLGIIGSDNESFGSSKSMGGGINFNLNQNWGVGIKLNFSTHKAASITHYDVNGITILLDILDEPLLADEYNTISSEATYDVAPVIVNGYYRWHPPSPALQNLTLIAGAGAGVYTTTIEVHNCWDRNYHYYWPYIIPFENFYDFRERYVAKPLGAFLMGGISFKGSGAFSANLGFEYHLIPTVELKETEWSQHDVIYYPSSFSLPEYQDYVESFFDYRPDELSLSGLRLTASVQISF
jgi:hypothetical protein